MKLAKFLQSIGLTITLLQAAALAQNSSSGEYFSSPSYNELSSPEPSESSTRLSFTSVSTSDLSPEPAPVTQNNAEVSALAPNPEFAKIIDRLEKLEKEAAKNAPSSEGWKVKLGGHVQLDYVNWAKADAAITGPAAFPGTQDYFEFRRLRLTADGSGYRNLDFRLQMTLEPETIGESPIGQILSPDVKDAYLSMNEIPYVGRFRIGNFFVPFGLEQVTNDTMNIFLERSIPTQGVFTPDREVGIATYNCTEDKYITWSYGIFFDSISEGLKERIDDNQGYRLSGRWTCLPYYDESSSGRYLFHLGAGVLYTDDQNGVVRFRTRPQIHEGPRLIDSGFIDADRYTTGNLEAAIVCGSFAVQSEAFLSGIDRNVGGTANIGGGYIHASYFLTGENRNFEPFGQHGAQFGRNKTFRTFFLTRGRGCSSWGAWEAKIRYSNLNLNQLASGEYNDLTVGMNWYWNNYTRIMFDWIHPITSPTTTFGRTSSDLLAMRFDFNW